MMNFCGNQATGYEELDHLVMKSSYGTYAAA